MNRLVAAMEEAEQPPPGPRQAFVRPPPDRRLQAPRISRSRITLPQLLVKQLEKTEVRPVAASSYSSTSSLPPDEDVAAVSPELARRRKHHPRLRWLRLSSTPPPEVAAGAPNSSPTGILKEVPREATGLMSLGESGSLRAGTIVPPLALSGAGGETIIGPGSLFFTGRLVSVEQLMRPLFRALATDGAPGRLGEVMLAPILPQVKVPGGSPLSLTASSFGPAPPSAPAVAAVLALPAGRHGNPRRARPALLPRPQPQAPAVAGTVATVCLPDLGRRVSVIDPAARTQDRKYHLRQAPVSHLSMAAEHPENRAAISQAAEYLSFENWSLADDYVETLLHQAKLSQIIHMNLSDNRITRHTVDLLTELGEDLWRLESLQLARNRLLAPGGVAVATLIEQARPPLRELDLADNHIGDQACEKLCEALARCCRQLTGLGLAGNDLGRDNAGAALGTALTLLTDLTVLNMHWNYLHGADAAAFFEGVYDSSVRGRGRLCRLDLSWNRLGQRCAKMSKEVPSQHHGHHPSPAAGHHGQADHHPHVPEPVADLEGDVELAPLHELLTTDTLRSFQHAAACPCKACSDCTAMMKVLGAVLRDGQTLFHLDLSFNDIRASECAIIAQALRSNHTLFGLHMAGNEAAIDEFGFLIPRGPTTEAAIERHQLALESYPSLNAPVRTDLAAAVVGAVPSLLPMLQPSTRRPPPEAGLYGSSKLSPSLRSVGHLRCADHPPPFSRQDLALEKEWAAMKAKVQQPLDFGVVGFEDVHRDASCCWICENWSEHVVAYTPTVSGREKSADEVEQVLAFFSSDHFSCPLRLTKELPDPPPSLQPDRRSTSTSESWRGAVRRASRDARISRFGGIPGAVVRWTGTRMLPPSNNVPVHVVFQVNDTLCIAEDLPSKPLRAPFPSVALRPFRPKGASTGADAAPGQQGGPVVRKVEVVNIITGQASQYKALGGGKGPPLVIMEDPARRGGLRVSPRTVA